MSRFPYFHSLTQKQDKYHSLSYLQKHNIWGLELAVLEIRNVPLMMHSCLHFSCNHRCLKHSRKLTNVPGEMYCFLILSPEILVRLRRDEYPLFTTRNVRWSWVRQPLHFLPLISSCSHIHLSQTCGQYSVILALFPYLSLLRTIFQCGKT